MKSDTDLRLDDIFGRLRLPDLLIKYGDNEIERIKTVLMKTPIYVVQAQNQLQEMKTPCISIHLLGDTESEDKAGFDDYEGEATSPIEPQILVDIFTPLSYDSQTGIITVADAVDLSKVYEGMFFMDGLGQPHTITADLSNIAGEKYFTIEADAIGLQLVNSSIVSSVNETIHQVNYIPTDENIMIGIHSENSLLTKYLYYIVRYLMYSKKNRFVEYQCELSKYNGSDFAIAPVYIPEQLYSRWITAQFKTYNFWRGEKLTVIDSISPNVGGAGPYVEIECDFIPTNYEPLTGVVSVVDGVNLLDVMPGHWFFDGAGKIFKIFEVNGTVGSKSFTIAAGQTVDLTFGCIKRKYTIRAEAESDRVDEEDKTWETDVEDE